MGQIALLWPFAAALVLIWAAAAVYRRHREAVALAVVREVTEAGLTEPASLHPVIDPAICIGCGACVSACPEGKIIGLVAGKAKLLEPTRCIGHGACAAACPVHGISLVFGTEKRGVDIPNVNPDFQTNVPGIYIAGELGGMGLIRNAIEQGRQAMDALASSGRRGKGDDLDLVIIGAGPAGVSASLAAKEAGLRYVTLEQDSLGGTVAHFPRGKLVMTAPAHLPLVGMVNFREVSKEELVGFWQKVVDEHALDMRYETRVEAVERESGAFRVKATEGEYRAANVLLAIGRRGTPRKLGVPGEDQGKVVYRLIDPEQYRGRRVLVVGGGDSAIEAACSVAEESGCDVAISYRGDAFARAKAKNRQRIEALAAANSLKIYLSSTVTEITRADVALDVSGKTPRMDNDDVIVCAGGILPTGFVKSMGIEVETKHGTA